MRVGKTIPDSDVQRRFGFQHKLRLNESVLIEEYERTQASKTKLDLCNDKTYRMQFGMSCE